MQTRLRFSVFLGVWRQSPSLSISPPFVSSIPSSPMGNDISTSSMRKTRKGTKSASGESSGKSNTSGKAPPAPLPPPPPKAGPIPLPPSSPAAPTSTSKRLEGPTSDSGERRKKKPPKSGPDTSKTTSVTTKTAPRDRMSTEPISFATTPETEAKSVPLKSFAKAATPPNTNDIEKELRELFRGNGREKAKFIRKLREETLLPDPIPPMKDIIFASQQIVVSVNLPKNRTYKKKRRSKTDPWRRYGALRKLYEIGGWAYDPNTAEAKRGGGSSRRSRLGKRLKFVQISKGTPFLVPEPTTAPISSVDTLIGKRKKKRREEPESED